MNAQVVNYINNGSFEDCVNCNTPPYIAQPRFWGAIDSLDYSFFYCGTNAPISNLPGIGNGYQFPRTGNNMILSGVFCATNSCIYIQSRGYPRNRMKQKLKANVPYCVRYYVNNRNTNPLAIDGFGAYFGNETLDTISYCSLPLSYIVPQVRNATGNIITDTLRWVAVTGTFVANGDEKYMVLGNFESNVATNTMLINPTQLPDLYTDVFYDDVSVIELNLPAYAGRDTMIFAGDSVFLGREPDVGINEACVWYQMPDMTNPIDTIAGFWIKPTNTETYVVRQEICGNVKWDTVVVKPVLHTGYSRFQVSGFELQLFPNPAENFLELRSNKGNLSSYFDRIGVYNNLSQLVIEEEIRQKIEIQSLPAGAYFLELSGSQGTIRKRFVVAR